MSLVDKKKKGRSRKRKSRRVEDISSPSSSSACSSENDSDGEAAAAVLNKHKVLPSTAQTGRGKANADDSAAPKERNSSTDSKPEKQKKKKKRVSPPAEHDASFLDDAAPQISKPNDSSPAQTATTRNSRGVESDMQPTTLTAEEPRPPTRAAKAQPQQDFETWYLRNVTEQYANDLEKLRNAPDFKDSTVPILVQALKQGASLFSESEKRLIMESERGAC